MSQAVGGKGLVHGAGDNCAIPPVGRHVEAGTFSECHHSRLQRSHLWVGHPIGYHNFPMQHMPSICFEVRHQANLRSTYTCGMPNVHALTDHAGGCSGG